MIDIQKERAAFEKLQLGNGVTQLHRSEDGGYQSASLDYCWHIWIKSAETKLAEINQLKAKVNAVTEGFVLVPKECSDNMAEIIAITAKVCGGIAGDVYDAVVKQAMIEALKVK